MISPAVFLQRMTADPWLSRVAWFLAASWLFFLLRALWRVARAPAGTRMAELNRISWIMVGALLISLFISFVVIAGLVYALFPQWALLTAPLACEGRAVIAVEGGTHVMLCKLASGEAHVMTDRIVEASGALHALVIATLLLWRTRVGWPMRARRAESAAHDGSDDAWSGRETAP